jgi:hypothetical protein
MSTVWTAIVSAMRALVDLVMRGIVLAIRPALSGVQLALEVIAKTINIVTVGWRELLGLMGKTPQPTEMLGPPPPPGLTERGRAPESIADYEAVLQEALTAQAAYRQAQAVTQAQERMAAQERQAAAEAQRQQAEALLPLQERLRRTQSEMTQATLSGVAAEVAAIRERRDQRMADLADLQRDAKGRLDITQAQAQAEAVMQMERQRLAQETTQKLDDLLAQLADTQAEGVAAELARIDRVRKARRKEVEEYVAGLRLIASGTDAAAQEAQQKLVTLDLSQITGDIDRTAMREKFRALTQALRNLAPPEGIGLPLNVRLSLLDQSVADLKAKIIALAPEIQKDLPGFDVALALRQVDVAGKTLKDAEIVQSAEEQKRRAIEETLQSTIVAYQQGDFLEAQRLTTKTQNLAFEMRMMQAQREAIMAGDALGAQFFEAQQERIRAGHLLTARLAMAGYDMMRTAFLGMAGAMDAIGQAFFDKETRRRITLGNLSKAVARNTAAAFAEGIQVELQLLAKKYAILAAGAAISLNFAQAARYAALAAAAGFGAGVAGGVAARQRNLAEGSLKAPTPTTPGGGGQGGEGGGVAPQGVTQAAVTVQREHVVHISPTVVIDAGNDIFIGTGSVEEFKLAIGRVTVEAVQDALTTGQIRIGRG